MDDTLSLPAVCSLADFFETIIHHRKGPTILGRTQDTLEEGRSMRGTQITSNNAGRAEGAVAVPANASPEWT